MPSFRTVRCLVALVVPLCAFQAYALQHRTQPADLLLSLTSLARTDKALDELCREYGFRLKRSLPHHGFAAVQLPAGMSSSAAAALLAVDSRVDVAEPDARVYAAFIPSDSLFGRQWALYNPHNGRADVKAPEAWDVTRGRRRVVVAIIDSGIEYDHPDLAANIWRNPGEIAGNGRDDDGNGFVDDIHGWDFAYNTSDPVDHFMHGTLMAGIIGAETGNRTGIAGIMHDVAMMSVKGLGDYGYGFSSDLIAGIYYAVDNGAAVINASWGGGGYVRAMQGAIEYAAGRGVIFVAAAGNWRRDNDTEPFYPASYEVDNVISVAASDILDSLANFSHYGRHSVDIAAPGVRVISTTIGRRYLTTSGTSMAAPHVTGCIGLLMAYAPALSYREYVGTVLASADRLAHLEGKCVSGGRLNILRALERSVAGRRDVRVAVYQYWRMRKH